MRNVVDPVAGNHHAGMARRAVQNAFILFGRGCPRHHKGFNRGFFLNEIEGERFMRLPFAFSGFGERHPDKSTRSVVTHDLVAVAQFTPQVCDRFFSDFGVL